MAYTIKKSDGTILLTLADNKVDQLTTSLALIGKNVDSYGQNFNNNLIGLLENFASVNEPRSPLTGQLWYNKTDGRMYIYGLGNVFKPVASTQVSASKPTLFNQGDLWVDTTNKQLWFTPDGSDFVLAAPQYSAVDGKSGWIVETITDITKSDHIVASLYNKGTLLGIASSDSFIFDVARLGMSSVAVGFNLNTSLNGIRFIGTATSAESIQGITPNLYIRNDQNGTITGSLSLLNNNGLFVGSNQDVTISIDSQNASISHNTTNKGFRIRGVNSNVGYFTAMQIDTNNRRIGLFNENPQYSLDITGDTRITGNLYIIGTSTNVQSNNLQITDKNIQLAYGQFIPNDTAIEGGGITLIGTSDHTISWTASYGNAWQFNDNINLPSSSDSYKINGISVVDATSLGSGVVDAPGLRRTGVLDYLTVTNVVIQGSTISSTGSNVTLYLEAAGTGTIDVSGERITSVAAPINPLDAANKKYIDDKFTLVGTKGFVFSMDVSNMINETTELIPYLDKMLPIINTFPGDSVFDLPDGVRARVLCSRTTISTPQNNASIDYSTTVVSGQTVVASIASNAIVSTQTGITPVLSFVVQEFRVLNGEWGWTRTIS